MVNVVDDKDLSDIIFPAIIEKEICYWQYPPKESVLTIPKDLKKDSLNLLIVKTREAKLLIKKK